MDKKIMTQLPLINTALIVVVLFAMIVSHYVILGTIHKSDVEKVGGEDNYKLVQELYASEKFAQQQKLGIQQALDAANGTAPSAQQPSAQPKVPQTLSLDAVKKLIDGLPLRGAKNPKLVMIEYSDLECPFCKVLHDSGAYKEVMAKYPKDVAVAFKHYPLPFHANAQKEAEAAECVQEIGGDAKYFEYIDQIFTRTTSNGQGFALTSLGTLAAELGLNKDKVQKCIDDGKYASKVAADTKEGQSFGVTGTPGSVLINIENGKWLDLKGAVPTSEFMRTVETLLQ